MICSKCHLEKNEEEFSYKTVASGIRRRDCKACVKEWRKIYYKENKKKLISKNNKWVKIIQERNQNYVLNYLLTHPCIMCGEDDPIVLEFDHKDRTDKSKEISSAVVHGWSIKKIENEIQKCDVLCANCHKRRTAEQFNWFRFKNKRA